MNFLKKNKRQKLLYTIHEEVSAEVRPGAVETRLVQELACLSPAVAPTGFMQLKCPQNKKITKYMIND